MSLRKKSRRMINNDGIFFDYPTRYTRPYDEGYMDISNIVFDGIEGSVNNSSASAASPTRKI